MHALYLNITDIIRWPGLVLEPRCCINRVETSIITSTSTGDKQKQKHVSKEPDVPAVQMTTFANWEQMGRWYASLEKDRRQPTAEIRTKAAELTKGKTTDLNPWIVTPCPLGMTDKHDHGDHH